MKKQIKLLLLTAILSIATSSFVCGQSNINRTFIGYWTTDGSKARLVIFKDKDDIPQIVKWDSSDGEEIEVLKIQVVGNSIKTTEKTPSTNWVIYCTYTIVDENNLKCVIGGDANNTVIYLKRLK